MTAHNTGKILSELSRLLCADELIVTGPLARGLPAATLEVALNQSHATRRASQQRGWTGWVFNDMLK